MSERSAPQLGMDFLRNAASERSRNCRIHSGSPLRCEMALTMSSFRPLRVLKTDSSGK